LVKTTVLSIAFYEVATFNLLTLLFRRIEVLSQQRVTSLVRIDLCYTADCLQTQTHIQQVFVNLSSFAEGDALSKDWSHIVDVGKLGKERHVGLQFQIFGIFVPGLDRYSVLRL
jgi:hypothetical protein